MTTKVTYQFNVDSRVLKPEAVEWTLKVFSQYAGFEIGTSSKQLSVGYDSNSDIVLSNEFWTSISKRNYSSKLLNNTLIQKDEDLVATAFYFLNCLWERDPARAKDHWGRSEFSSSIWKEFGFDAPFNIVNQCFDALASQLAISIPQRKSSVFLSHDVDAVFSAWQEDGKAALKKGKIGPFFKGVKDQMAGNPAWFNFEEIVELEQKYNSKSTFFWITTDKPVPGVGKNADYKILSPQMQDVVKRLTAMGASHGIHKSIDSTSLKEEVGQIGMTIVSNRYHYLKYRFDKLIGEVNDSGLTMDASLGYAEVHGYRNGYSLPFIPFDIENNCAAGFIEVPLCIMDATFSRYYKMKGDDALKSILDFINQNQTNSVISVLWHNTHFTNFKYEGYPQVYEGILKKIENDELETVTPSELIDKFLD